jgi:hypothetical protein
MAAILTKSINNAKLLLLNKPKQLNALTLEMVDQIDKNLKNQLTIIASTDEKAFCAGGDIKTVILDKLEGRNDEAISFFNKEYRLDHVIGTMDSPVVVVMDGITSTSSLIPLPSLLPTLSILYSPTSKHSLGIRINQTFPPTSHHFLRSHWPVT